MSRPVPGLLFIVGPPPQSGHRSVGGRRPTRGEAHEWRVEGWVLAGRTAGGWAIELVLVGIPCVVEYLALKPAAVQSGGFNRGALHTRLRRPFEASRWDAHLPVVPPTICHPSGSGRDFQCVIPPPMTVKSAATFAGP